MAKTSPVRTDFQGDALLVDLLGALAPHAAKALVLHYDGRTIGGGYHLTEVKSASLAALDCGGNLDRWQETILQIEDLPSQDEDRHMSAGKFVAIFGQVAGRLPLSHDARLTFEVGRPYEAMRVFDVDALEVEQDCVVLDLAVRSAICKPRHRLAQPATSVPCRGGAAAKANCCP